MGCRLMNVKKCHEYILANYKDLTYEQMSHRTRMSPYKIRKFLNERGLTKEKIYDKRFFEHIDTPEKAYYLGLIYADGCVQEGKMIITLKSSDRAVLDRLAELLGGAHQVQLRQTSGVLNGYEYNTEIAALSICSQDFCKDLITHGVVQRKTYEKEYPRCENYFFDFLRGFLDGDGCIYTHEREIQIIFTGSNYNFLRYINAQIKKEYSTHGSLSSPDRWRKRLCFSRRDEIITLLNRLYEDKNSPRIERKYKKFIDFLTANNLEVVV